MGHKESKERSLFIEIIQCTLKNKKVIKVNTTI